MNIAEKIQQANEKAARLERQRHPPREMEYIKITAGIHGENWSQFYAEGAENDHCGYFYIIKRESHLDLEVNGKIVSLNGEPELLESALLVLLHVDPATSVIFTPTKKAAKRMMTLGFALSNVII